MARDYSLSVAAAMWRYAEDCADKERRNAIMTTKTDIALPKGITNHGIVGHDGPVYTDVMVQDIIRAAPVAAQAQPTAQDREDAEQYRWATALDDNSETLHSIVLSYGGDQAKINERVDVYRACDARAAKGADHG